MTTEQQLADLKDRIEGLAGDYADSGRSYESADIARALNDFAGRLANNLKGQSE